MLGDNVYADTPEFSAAPSTAAMVAEYEKLTATPGFAELRESIPVFATWDDHDYGLNDGGGGFAFKTQAEAVFEQFWGYTADDPVTQRAGIYAERRLTAGALEIQVILLDTRSFRGPLRDAERSLTCPLKNYEKNLTGSFLGAEQWQWLAEVLRKPADLRLLVSSQQVIPDQHCFEKWGNFPHERERLFALIKASGARNVVLLSGDRHLGELSVLPAGHALGVGYDLLEVTSSPLSARSGFGWGETNDFRVGGDNLRESQFGVLDISDQRSSPDKPGIRVAARLFDERGELRFEHTQHYPDAL